MDSILVCNSIVHFDRQLRTKHVERGKLGQGMIDQ